MVSAESELLALPLVTELTASIVSAYVGAGLAAVNMVCTLANGMLIGMLHESSPVEQFVELILENREFAERQGWVLRQSGRL
jgi:predicted transcriptional regulator